MNLARLSAAARNAGAAGLIAILAAPAAAWADGEIQLLLPLVRAMAFGVVAAQAAAPAEPALSSPFAAAPAPHRGLNVIPPRVRIPDGYSTEYEFAEPRFTSPVGRDRLVSFDLVSKPRHGWTASIAYDEESHRPFHGTGEVLRIFAHFGF